jgi:hypothetical protein
MFGMPLSTDSLNSGQKKKGLELQIDVDGVVQNKLKTDWTDDDKKKIQYDLKARTYSFPHSS